MTLSPNSVHLDEFANGGLQSTSVTWLENRQRRVWVDLRRCRSARLGYLTLPVARIFHSRYVAPRAKCFGLEFHFVIIGMIAPSAIRHSNARLTHTRLFVAQTRHKRHVTH